MVGSWESTTVVSSLALRLSCYVFFRWLPGHPFPPLISALAAVYFVSFFYTLAKTAPFEIVSNDVKIVSNPISEDEAARQGLPDSAEELDVEETLEVEERGSHPFLTLLTGLPSPTSTLWTYMTFGLNVLLVIGMLDLTYRAALFHPAHELSFTRLGYVSDTYAKILIREPDHQLLPIYLSYRYADTPVASTTQSFDGAWKHAEAIHELNEATDFTAVAIIKRLQPDTRYQYAFSNNKTGFFVTAPRPGEFSQRLATSSGGVPIATTGTLSFIHSSCALPRFPYNPFDHPLHIPGFSYLPKILAIVRPAFFLFLGDFIYIDVPRRHGNDAATYRREYRQVYASPDWPAAATVPTAHLGSSYDAYDLPWIHVYDDHEIANDWSAKTSGVYPAAFDPYNHYHIANNPDPVKYASTVPTSQKNQLTNDTYSVFTQGPASFFLADTRRFREPGKEYIPVQKDRATMLGQQQLMDLLEWLATPPAPGVRWKILVTSVPFTRNWRINSRDTWAGYINERRVILQAMWKVNADASASGQDGVRVVILSGDRHEHATTEFLPHVDDDRWGADTASVVEFSTSPASMFYLPFQTYREDPSQEKQGPISKEYFFAGGPELRDLLMERETCLHYEPAGNSKYGAVTIEGTTGSGQSILRYRLFVDSEETWSHVLVAPERSSGGKGWGRSKTGASIWA